MRNLRTFFLSGSIVLLIIILIVAFQNIQAQCTFITFFFFSVESNTSPTIIFLLVSLLGIISGGFLMGLVMSFLAKDEDEDDF